MSSDLKAALLRRCRAMEIPLVGVADVERWENPPFRPWMPEEFYPQRIFPEARSVIVIGLPVHLPALESAPSIWYRETYLTVNALLDQYTYRLAEYLNEEGYPSVFVPRDGYGGIGALIKKPVAFFSHRHAAYFAGLGTFGVNNMLLTPEYGPRVRFGSILTAAPLPPDPVMTEEVCNHCMRCVEMCPASALDREDYPAGLTDRGACARNSAELEKRRLAPCGICIKVCPIGKDRVFYGREDASVYARSERRPDLHRAWEHVRSYGGK
ncbi:epoxyqueuosine reductase [Methanofollis aquaemaris]|uniref:Epoxyqueuosine reductase n=1 Tax=Methanofollis aquaemaris TaxID=126734 RepID=A0A8A3S447_9EURY|nr:4Fe-4S binding protein [Methanofollis aquaemaris]QSZ66394.1 epoxyqueuosine reductase [Methanofollis aquaemaris]